MTTFDPRSGRITSNAEVTNFRCILGRVTLAGRTTCFSDSDLRIEPFDCRHGQEQPLWGFRERDKPEIPIKLMGLLVFGVDYDRRGCDLTAHYKRSFQCVDQEQLAHTVPSAGEIACKPSKERSTYSFVSWQIQLPDQFRRKIFRCNIVLRERVEARQLIVRGRKYVDDAGPPFNILGCLLFQVSVQFR